MTDFEKINEYIRGGSKGILDLSCTYIKGALLSDDKLTEANLSSAKLHTDKIPEDYKSNADLTRATLEKTILSRANLSGVNLSDAKLIGANLEGANLENADLEKVKRVLHELVTSDPRVLADPAPLIFVKELGDNSVQVAVRPWVKSEDYWTLQWDLPERVKRRFDAEGIGIPYPQRDVHLYPAVQPAEATKP